MYTKALRDLSKEDTAMAGGKAASLGELLDANLPVPDGFVVTTQAFDEFLKETDILQDIRSELNDVDRNAIHTIERASVNIQQLILNQEMPEQMASEFKTAFSELGADFVAVRSSATAEDGKDHAWAGQLDSYLNIEKENLIPRIQSCWASLFTPRAIFYRFEKGLKESNVSVAVVVQKMVNSELSGVAFSVHPITEDVDQIVIEAGFGLGEAIVSGQITPDSYVVSKKDNSLIDTNVNKQKKALYRGEGGNKWEELGDKGLEQVLNEDQIPELSKLVVSIEDHYGSPQDIEWAFAEGQFYITQSRPITTIKTNKSGKPVSGLLNPNDYVRMFAGKAFSFLLSDIFLVYYNTWGVVSIQDKTSWMSLLPKSSQNQTLKYGKELYTSKEKYNSFVAEFHDYIDSSVQYFKSILEKKDPLTAEEVRKYLELIAKHFSYYSKTEFFYTDHVTEETMAITVQEFDKLKLDGRAHLNKLIFEDSGYAKSLVRIISAQTQINLEDLFFYSIKEIVQLVAARTKPETGLILSRKDGFFASKDIHLFGKESESIVDEFFSAYRDVSDVIHGTTANGGRITARARVLIPDFSDFDKISAEVEKMDHGEILVAETTSPEIIQACNKAAAIITNQGGMLSHAAIVSRELGIPCIVGTDKDVILNIKNGDLIEVNANEGVIRIINE